MELNLRDGSQTPLSKKKITEIDSANCIDIKLYAKWEKKAGNTSITPEPSIIPELSITPEPSITSEPISSITPNPSDEQYTILKGSKELGFNERFYLKNFPTDGKITFKDEDVANNHYIASYSMDYDGGIIGGADRYEQYASAFSGEISKGRHFICLSSIMPSTWTLEVSYIFYPAVYNFL